MTRGSIDYLPADRKVWGYLLRGILGALLLRTPEIWTVGQEQVERGVQAVLLTFQVLSDPVGLGK